MRMLKITILFFLVAIPLRGHCSPILPTEVFRAFEGSFRITGNNLVVQIPISGEITFNLIEQSSTSNTYLDKTEWGFSGETTTGLLNFSGFLNNTDAVEMGGHPNDIDQLAWGPENWDSEISAINESFTNIFWDDFFCTFCGNEIGDSWNLVNNDNFLPDEILHMAMAGGLEDEQYLGELSLRFSASPVPEPTTIFLLGFGLLVLVRMSKTKFNKKGNS